MFILKLIEWLGREKTESESVSTKGEDLAFLVTIAVIIGTVMLLDMWI